MQGSIGEILGATAYYSIIFMILFLFLYLFILYGGEQMFHQVWSVVPAESKPKLSILNVLLSDSLYSLIIVHVGIALLVFVVALPFFTLLGYGHVLFWSIVCAIFALIPPVFGPVIIIALLAVYALSLGDYYALVLILVIGWPLLCAIPDWYLRPVLMGGKRSKMNAVLIFIALFGGIAIMGVLGFLYGPLALAILTAVYRILFHEFGGGDDQPVPSESP
ncbi:AI-2E family transporter [Methanogenium cariaci]|uniref:AI-2E family transporter n=1 Tax=Methanogenium cariaci TaxID=2197 RepID=UPI001FE072FE|nr:AI-2E family transporter [Methanogenium cariaci]